MSLYCIIKKLLIALAMISMVLSGTHTEKTGAGDYVVAIGEDSSIAGKLSNIETLVIDAEYFSVEDIEKLKKNNVKEIYSYLNIGSVEEFREYYDEFLPYTLGEYENWPEERWMDVSCTEWQDFTEARAKTLLEKGIDGFFIDNTDIFYLYPSEKIYQGIVDILAEIKTYGKPVIINGGDEFVKAYIESNDAKTRLFDGVNQESVYTRYDFSSNEFSTNSREVIEYYSDYFDILVKEGYRVYVLEYATDPDIIAEASYFSKKRNYTCYISDNIELKIQR